MLDVGSAFLSKLPVGFFQDFVRFVLVVVVVRMSGVGSLFFPKSLFGFFQDFVLGFELVVVVVSMPLLLSVRLF